MSRHSIIMHEPLFLQMVSWMDVRQVRKCARYWIGNETSDSENLCVHCQYNDITEYVYISIGNSSFN